MWNDFSKQSNRASILQSWPSLAGSAISNAFDFKGPGFCFNTGASGGLTSIGEAMWRIKTGEADAMLVVAGDVVNQLALSSMKLHSCVEASPFDVDRKGFMFGEGAGALMLEAADLAEARGADVYAEIVGYACRPGLGPELSDDYNPLMEETFRRTSPGPVDLVYANACGLRADSVEARVLERLYKTAAVTSVKGQVGQVLGAAGAFNAAFAAASIKKGIVPAIVNLSKPEPADLDFVRRLRRQDVQSALVNSFDLGGVTASIMLQKYLA